MNVPRDGTNMASKNKQNMLEIIQHYSRKGVSDKSIAIKCGLDLAQFYEILEMEQDKIKPFKAALELGRADFEIDRVEAKDEIMNDPEISLGLKYKVIREDLKTLEAWAPAAKTVNVKLESAATVLDFTALTEEQEDAIKASREPNDSNEEDSKED